MSHTLHAQHAVSLTANIGGAEGTHCLIDGFKIGIVSNTSRGSPAFLWREEIGRLGLGQRVDDMVFCRDVGWRKPAKQIFEFALQKFNTNPENCIFVGDHQKWDL